MGHFNLRTSLVSKKVKGLEAKPSSWLQIFLLTFLESQLEVWSANEKLSYSKTTVPKEESALLGAANWL